MKFQVEESSSDDYGEESDQNNENVKELLQPEKSEIANEII